MVLRGWTVKCLCRRLNSNKKKGQSPYTKKKIWIPINKGPEIGKFIDSWEIVEVTEEYGFY